MPGVSLRPRPGGSESQRMTTGELTVERAGVAAAEEILPILEAAFGRWPAIDAPRGALEHLQWKLAGPPGGPEHTHTIVREGDAVVAVEPHWLGWAHVGSAVIPFDRGIDLAVHPLHQGRGVARLIFDDDGVRNPPLGDFIRWDTPSRDERVTHLEGDGHLSRTMREWVHRSGPRPLLRALRARHFRGAGQSLRALLPRRPAPRRASPYQIADIAHFDQDTDDLWERARATFDIARVRDAAYLNWRYLDPRGGTAEVVGARTPTGALVGYVVLKRSAGIGQVVDLVFDPDAPDATTDLLAEAARRLRATHSDTVVCWLPIGHPAETSLAAAGFDRGPDRVLQLQIEWLRIRTDLRALAVNVDTRLHVTMGDFDFV